MIMAAIPLLLATVVNLLPIKLGGIVPDGYRSCKALKRRGGDR